MVWLILVWMVRVSKGVRDLPGNFQASTSNVPSGKSFLYFGLFLAVGIFFIFIAFTMFLPVIVLVPQKFAICFTIGCALTVGSFFALKGPKNQLAHMFSKEVAYLVSIILYRFSLNLLQRLSMYTQCTILKSFLQKCFVINTFCLIFCFQRLPLTLISIGSMVGTVYVSMVLHSYILSVLFSVLQVL